MQMMPTLISTVDQTPASKKSHVGLTVLAPAWTSDRSRSMLTMVTLDRVRLAICAYFGQIAETHKVPTQNIIATPTFFLMSRFRLLNCQSGMPSIHASSAMLMAALLQPMPMMSMHVP